MAGKDITELQYLKNYYEKEGSQLVVFYGQKNMGMTALLRRFCDELQGTYYRVRACSEREQQFQWANELRENGAKLPDYPTYTELFMSMIEQRSHKKVIVIEEFQNIVKLSETFMRELIAFFHDQWNNQEVMIILASTSIGWVENSMVGKIGSAVYEISGLIKMREPGFFDVADLLPESGRKQQIETYAVLGGFPELWSHFDKDVDVRENICRHILRRGSYLREEALRLVSDELRETNVYHAILCALASGRYKLNDLYLHTGFSRAKISVYLKNLMELEIVEKVFSYDTAGRENTQKGIYRIKNYLVKFYFRYLYCNLSRLEELDEYTFYDRYIAPSFSAYVSECFGKVCAEAAGRMDSVPFSGEKMGEWVGKAGNIDIVMQDTDNHFLIGMCNWDRPQMSFEDYEWLMFCAGQAKIKPDQVVLFSATGFEEKLISEERGRNDLKLFTISQL